MSVGLCAVLFIIMRELVAVIEHERMDMKNCWLYTSESTDTWSQKCLCYGQNIKRMSGLVDGSLNDRLIGQGQMFM